MLKRSLIILFVLMTIHTWAEAMHIVGHRGARGRFPENTIIGFKKALQLGATMLELDVVMTKDKQLVVSHDAFMSPLFCSKPDGSAIIEKQPPAYNIYRMDYADVKRFDCGKKGNPHFVRQASIPAVKPLLRDVFVEIHRYEVQHNLKKTPIIVEIKSKKSLDNVFYYPPKQLSYAVYKLISQYRTPNDTIILSFDERILQYWHRTHPEYPLAIAIGEDEALALLKKRIGFIPKYYAPRASLATKSLIQRLHKLSVKVMPWGADNVKALHRLIDLRVDGIVTDYPGDIKRLLQA